MPNGSSKAETLVDMANARGAPPLGMLTDSSAGDRGRILEPDHRDIRRQSLAIARRKLGVRFPKQHVLFVVPREKSRVH